MLQLTAASSRHRPGAITRAQFAIVGGPRLSNLRLERLDRFSVQLNYAKQVTTDRDVRRTFLLLGDPSMMLK